MPDLRFDHVAMLVEDLDASVEKWRMLLEVLDHGAGPRGGVGRGRGERREDALGHVQ